MMRPRRDPGRAPSATRVGRTQRSPGGGVLDLGAAQICGRNVRRRPCVALRSPTSGRNLDEGLPVRDSSPTSASGPK